MAADGVGSLRVDAALTDGEVTARRAFVDAAVLEADEDLMGDGGGEGGDLCGALSFRECERIRERGGIGGGVVVGDGRDGVV